jgi:cystathionine gamma-lyase
MAENGAPKSEVGAFKGFATACLHAGQTPDPTSGAVVVPISLATTFAQESPGHHKGFEYSRTNNPTRQAFEQCMASVEGGKHCLAFASGSAATGTILAMFGPGDHVVTIDDVYGGTNRYFKRISTPASGLTFSFIDFNKEGELEKAITSKTKLIWLETPTNPTLKIVDIKKTAEIAKKHNCLLVVDNTFASPYFQRPLDLGADITYHSITKYVNGHSDVVGGVVITRSDEINTKLRFLQNGLGAILSPFDSWMALRGVKTLFLRMREHEKNAFAVARFLEKHPKVDKVIYPGLPSHPNHETAKKQMSGFSGMVTFYLKGGLKQSSDFLSALKLFSCAESLGAVESLAEHPAIMTHASVAPAERATLGISDSLCRLSVGLEDIDDIIGDLSQALEKVQL